MCDILTVLLFVFFHCIIIWIYNVFTIDQVWCKCVNKYGIHDFNTIVNIKDSLTIAEMSHIQYLRTYLNKSKYNVNPNYYGVFVPFRIF